MHYLLHLLFSQRVVRSKLGGAVIGEQKEKGLPRRSRNVGSEQSRAAALLTTYSLLKLVPFQTQCAIHFRDIDIEVVLRQAINSADPAEGKEATAVKKVGIDGELKVVV